MSQSMIDPRLHPAVPRPPPPPPPPAAAAPAPLSHQHQQQQQHYQNARLPRIQAAAGGPPPAVAAGAAPHALVGLLPPPTQQQQQQPQQQSSAGVPSPSTAPLPPRQHPYPYYNDRQPPPPPQQQSLYPAVHPSLPVRSPSSAIDPVFGAHQPSAEGDDGEPYMDDDQTSPPYEGLLSDPNDPKRQRACEACRGLKVRCDQDPNNPDLPCKRCAKAKRQCIITAPTRKRVKKTDSRVAELEKRIEALQASIQSGAHGVSSPESPRHGPDFPSPNTSVSSARAVRSPVSRYGQDLTESGSVSARTPEGHASAGTKRHRSNSHSEMSKRRSGPSRASIHLDRSNSDAAKRAMASIDGIIDEVLDKNEAERMFAHYLSHLVPHLPTVAFPPDVKANDVRRDKPILFLSILSAASVGLTDVWKQKSLSQSLMGVFADCIIRDGEKSLELIQALQVATVWYRPPRRYEQMNFYQLSHIAAVMAIDVGMGKKLSRGKSWRIQISSDQMRSAKHIVNPDSLEARRTWLGCYFLCANVSMSLRRPNLIRWNSYMDECIEVLESSSTALASDKILCQHVKLQHINEDIGIQFSMDDPSASVTISESHVQYALKAFERQLGEWTKAVPSAIRNPDLTFCEHVSNLYMHEVALHFNHNVDDFRAPFTEESIRAQAGQPDHLSPAHSRALSECLTAVHGIFKTFFGLEMDVVRALPIFYFIRVAYAVVVLIKLYFAVTAKNSEVGRIINVEDLEVETTLEKLLAILSTLNEQNAFRPATRFLLILTKLRDWFQNNKDSKDGTKYNPWGAAVSAHKEAQAQGQPPSTRTRKPVSPVKKQQAASQSQAPAQYDNQTALHFLSDVATTSADPVTNHQQQQQSLSPSMSSSAQQGWYQGVSPTSNVAPPRQIPDSMQGGPVMPGWDANADYAMGSGFEQAMDMTLGMSDPDLNSFFLGGDPTLMFSGYGGQDQLYYNNGPNAPPTGPGWG